MFLDRKESNACVQMMAGKWRWAGQKFSKELAVDKEWLHFHLAGMWNEILSECAKFPGVRGRLGVVSYL
jgi:hypothetical protein